MREKCRCLFLNYTWVMTAEVNLDTVCNYPGWDPNLGEDAYVI
jgi:hypothetical protein